MSYEVFVQRFESGESAAIPFEELSDILSKFGRIDDGYTGLEFYPDDTYVCDCAPLSGDQPSAITGICFSRPAMDHRPFFRIVFDLLGIGSTCFFGPDLTFMQSRTDSKIVLPGSLNKDFPNGPEVITEIEQLHSWPS